MNIKSQLPLNVRIIVQSIANLNSFLHQWAAGERHDIVKAVTEAFILEVRNSIDCGAYDIDRIFAQLAVIISNLSASIDDFDEQFEAENEDVFAFRRAIEKED